METNNKDQQQEKQSTQQQTGQQQNAQHAQATEFDYGKIQHMLDGTLAAKEETALKAYFKQQGLTQEEMQQAIAQFKKQKAEKTPDVHAIEQQLMQAQQQAQQAEIEKQATLEALTLGVDMKTVPYVLKLVNLSEVTKEDGKINTEALQNALKKVLEDVPALKSESKGNTGFRQIGASPDEQQNNNDERIAEIFGNKKG